MPRAVADGRDYEVLDYDNEIEVDLKMKQIKGRERIRVRSLQDNLEQVGFPRNGIDVVALRSEAGAPLSRGPSIDRVDVRLSKPLRRNQITTIAWTTKRLGRRGSSSAPGARTPAFSLATG